MSCRIAIVSAWLDVESPTSANFPVLIVSLFWRRFNTGGVIGGMTMGLVSWVMPAKIRLAMRGADAHWSIRALAELPELMGTAGR